MTDRQATCEERIGEVMQHRADYLAGLYRVIDGEASTFDGDYEPAEEMTDEDAHERIHELPLAVTIERVLRIDLSTGGPADYITAKLEREGYGWAPVSAQYHYADWFDHAARPIPEDSPLWRYVEDIAEIVGDSVED